MKRLHLTTMTGSALCGRYSEDQILIQNFDQLNGDYRPMCRLCIKKLCPATRRLVFQAIAAKEPSHV